MNLTRKAAPLLRSDGLRSDGLRSDGLRSDGLALATLAALGLAAIPRATHAQAVTPVTVTLDHPFQVTPAPGSGTTTLDFTGTVTTAPGYSVTESNLDVPFSATSVGLNSSFGPADVFGASNGGTVHGVLFTVDVPAGTAPDFYGFYYGPAGPALFSVSANDGSGGPDTTASAAFSVTVTPAPEPSCPAALSVGALGLGALAVTARRRRALA